VLLHPKANLRAINGVYERRLPGEAEPYLRFRYRVIRVWELPVETVLQAGLSVLPLAPISAVRAGELPTVIGRIEQRLAAEPNQETVGKLWTATKVLLGLRYQAPFIEQMLQGVRAMKESTTYQAILEEGALAAVRRTLLRLGEDLFGGPPAPDQQAAIAAITDEGRLEDLIVRAVHVASWSELLAAPTPRRRKKS
jgi:hypothetical protein